MDGSRKYLTEKELEEIVREIEASQSDDIGFSHDSSDSGSESEGHEEIDDVEEDVTVCSPNENDSSDDEIPLSDLQRKVIYGKNGYKWYCKPFIQKNTRTLQKNIVLRLPGPKDAAAGSAHTEYEAWKLFFTDDILSEILVHTNEEINRTKTNFLSEQRYIDVTNKTELEALFGLLYSSGALKDNHVDVEELWSKQYGPPIFRATMSKNRFSFLIKNLRFDDKTTRNQRKELDKFSAIRKIWDSYVRNCQDNYTPSAYVTVDEQLLGFRGRCPFLGLTNSLREVGLTVVGTLRKNKPEIPPEFLKPKISTPNRFAFTQDVVLVSHTPRKNKVVMLLSTMHTNDEVDQSSGKSEGNLFYNATKGGVDVFHQLCHSKSAARRSKRWPLRVFYGMLDGGVVNAYVIYEANNVSARKTPRKKFLLQLANDLAKEHMKKGLEIPNLT
nr:unnamed protein product [Callosobruchus analis]